MHRVVPLLMAAAAVAPLAAQESHVVLNGTITNGVYISPTGAFQIEVPVLAALGGSVHDTARVVTFQDSFGLQITVGAFPQDATLKWEYSTRGTKDYLVYFFSTYVLPDLKHFCAGTRIESARFAPDFVDGTLFTYILMPGGSVVQQEPVFGPAGPPPVAKRGNALFVHNGFTFVISTELSERVTEGAHYNKTTEQEDQILRARLVDVVKKMSFVRAAPPKSGP
jgi:hypothetical protein